MTYEFVRTKKATFPLTLLCKTLNISTSAFYTWSLKQDQKTDEHEQNEDIKLRVHIRAIFKENDGTYGRPRITRQLRKQGFTVNEKRVERIMREEQLYARPKPRFKNTTTPDPTHPVASIARTHADAAK